MTSRVVVAGIAVAGMVATSGVAWWYLQRPVAVALPISDRKSAAQRPVTVEVTQVQAVQMADEVQAVGSLRSRQGVVLRPEVSGRVAALHFRDGERVRKGQLLVQLDDRLPQAQVKQAQAELAIAMVNHKRNQELLAQHFISQRSVDESAANVEVAQAKLALAQAAAARLKIYAPFDGVVGIRSVSVGDYLKDGTDIVNIEDIDTVYVDYRLPERYQRQVRAGLKVTVELDALPGRRFDARVLAIDPLIDVNGRSIGVRAGIINRDLLLRPGMFARVTTVFGVRERVRVLPEEAIVQQGAAAYVYKLIPGSDAGMVSKRVEVKVGIRRAGQVEVLDGVQEGDTVVTAGQQRLLRDGTVVRVLDSKRAPD